MDVGPRAGRHRRPGATPGLGARARLVPAGRARPGPSSSEPVLLLADEPSSGLDIHETHELAQVLRTLQRERGMAMLLVEHDLGMVGEVVDRTIVMNLGEVIAEGTFDEVMADADGPPRLPGGRAREPRSTGPVPPATVEPAPADRHCRPSRSSTCAPATVPTGPCSTSASRCPSGGITALIGSNGAGKSTVSRVVTGLLASTAGTIRLSGPGRHRAARLQDRPGRDGPRPRGPGDLRQPHRRGEPQAGLPPARRSPVRSPTSLRPRLRGVPDPRRAPQPARGHALRRRAAHPLAGQGAGASRPACWSPTRSRSVWRRW